MKLKLKALCDGYICTYKLTLADCLKCGSVEAQLLELRQKYDQLARAIGWLICLETPAYDLGWSDHKNMSTSFLNWITLLPLWVLLVDEISTNLMKLASRNQFCISTY